MTEKEENPELALLDKFGVTYDLFTDGWLTANGGLPPDKEGWTRPQRMDTICAYVSCKRDDAFQKYKDYCVAGAMETIKEAAKKFSGSS